MDDPLSPLLAGNDPDVMTPYNYGPDLRTAGWPSYSCPFTSDPKTSIRLAEVLAHIDAAPWQAVM